MNNIFDVIDPKFFHVFSGENRRINADFIMLISEFFNRHNSSFVNKEDLVNYLTEYIETHDLQRIVDEEEGKDISLVSSREKALAKINLLKRNGWLGEEIAENYQPIIQLDENALMIIKVFQDISSNSAPKEYTGYLIVIDNSLRYFDYSQGISILEQIVENTNMLMTRLRGLNSSIKKYLTKLLNDDQYDAKKLLEIMLGEYQDNVINKVFNNLKQKDNPSKFRNRILAKLDELKSAEGIAKLVENYKTTKRDEAEENIQNWIVDQIDIVYENIEYLQNTIQMIDVKNAKYHKSTTSKLQFILNENYDVEGKIKSILRLMKNVKDDSGYEDAFGIYKLGFLDPKSLYKPRKSRSMVDQVSLAKSPVIDQTYVDRIKANLFRENRFSRKTVNDYVKKLLQERNSIYASELALESYDDATRIILIHLYRHYEGMCYRVHPLDSLVENRWMEYPDFEIRKKSE
jgi:hypothetical protein